MKLSQCLDLSPLDMASYSPVVQSALSYLVQQCNSVTLPALRSSLLGLLANPAPTFLALYPTAESRAAILTRLQSEGLVETSLTESAFFPPCRDPLFAPQPFWCAPGSDYERHHSHPGGLALHTAANMRLSLAAADAYQQTYGQSLNRDLLISAQVLHDCMKPWVLQWQPDGSLLAQARAAGSGAHHILSLAESIYYGMPPVAVIAQCCTHSPPGDEKGEAEVVRWLRAGALLAGQDAVECDLVTAEGRLPQPHRQEWYVSHLGDHDWVLSVKSAELLISELRELASLHYNIGQAEQTGARFNVFRNWIFSQCSISFLHQLFIISGQPGLLVKISEYIEPD